MTTSKIKARTSPGSKGGTKLSAAKGKGRVKAPVEPKDPVLEEIEIHLLSFSYNMDSPATDSDGHVWRKVGFSGPRSVFKKLLQHPVAQKLHTLTVAGRNGTSSEFKNAIADLAAGPPLASLRELRLGVLPEGQSAGSFGKLKCSDLSALATACPRLEVLRLLCPGFVAGAHPTLRVLDARLGALASSVASLASAELPKLEELHLGYEVDQDEPLNAALLWKARARSSLDRGEPPGAPAPPFVAHAGRRGVRAEGQELPARQAREGRGPRPRRHRRGHGRLRGVTAPVAGIVGASEVSVAGRRAEEAHAHFAVLHEETAIYAAIIADCMPRGSWRCSRHEETARHRVRGGVRRRMRVQG